MCIKNELEIYDWTYQHNAYLASPARVTRVYQDNRNPLSCCFVFDLLAQVIEGPGMMLIPLATFNRHPLANPGKVFQGYANIVPFRLFNNFLGYDVVYILCHPGLFTTAFSEQSFSGPCSLALQFLSQFSVAFSQVVEMVSGIGFAIRIGSNVFYAKINSEKFSYITLRRVFNIASNKEIKNAIAVNKVGFALLVKEQVKLMLTSYKRNFQPPSSVQIETVCSLRL